jgi:hypothetical protein
MATRIIEYGDKRRTDSFPVVPSTTKITAQTPLTANGTSAQSAAFNAATNMICVQSDEAVYVNIGTNPTATTSDYRIQAGGEQWFDVVAGQKVAVRT